MKAIINIQGIVGEDATLLGVIRQFKGFKSPTEVEVIINSHGGSVDEGMAIYSYLRKLNLPITTKANRAYSIAASIFMAGDVRLLEEGANRFMIHMPLVEMRGGSKMIEKVQPMLQEIENEFTAFYAGFMNIDEDSVRRLLDNETFLSSQEATEMGIATGTYSALKAVAFYDEELINKNETNTIMTKAEKLVKAFAEFLGNKEKDVEALALVIQDANGEDVNFPELDENQEPEVGSKVEGRDGEILMPDGSKIMVVEGAVSEIVPAPEEAPEEETPEAEVPAEEAPEEDAPEEGITEEDEDFLKLLEELKESILKEAKADTAKEVEGFKAEILALRKEVGSTLENEPTINTNKKNSQSGNYLTKALKNKRSK